MTNYMDHHDPSLRDDPKPRLPVHSDVARGLTFTQLRMANLLRLPQFRNAKGEIAHSETDGSDWTPNDWMVALVGEVGEAANDLKKLRRGDLSREEAEKRLAKEFADIVIYLDILAYQMGLDLGDATIDKFNEVSARVGSTVTIERVC